ncbi:MAG: 50S ribosomal protein L18Ae [Candidatus Nanohaloarchaea archaeon]
MEEYSFSGKIRMGNQWQKFERTVEAESEKHAEQKLLSELGSEHGVARGNIKLSE